MRSVSTSQRNAVYEPTEGRLEIRVENFGLGL